jgi:hypothetical protein
MRRGKGEEEAGMRRGKGEEEAGRLGEGREKKRQED